VDPPLPDMGMAEGMTKGDVAGQGNSTGGEGDECGNNGGCGGDTTVAQMVGTPGHQLWHPYLHLP
jgi:hypothetical protein